MCAQRPAVRAASVPLITWDHWEIQLHFELNYYGHDEFKNSLHPSFLHFLCARGIIRGLWSTPWSKYSFTGEDFLLLFCQWRLQLMLLSQTHPFRGGQSDINTEQVLLVCKMLSENMPNKSMFLNVSSCSFTTWLTQAEPFTYSCF